jgi:hypothetical protein
MIQELTESLTEMSMSDICWRGKGGWYVGLTTLPPSDYQEVRGT